MKLGDSGKWRVSGNLENREDEKFNKIGKKPKIISVCRMVELGSMGYRIDRTSHLAKWGSRRGFNGKREEARSAPIKVTIRSKAGSRGVERIAACGSEKRTPKRWRVCLMNYSKIERERY